MNTLLKQPVNPIHMWLMGYPTEWLNCVDSEMPSSRKLRQKSSDASTK